MAKKCGYIALVGRPNVGKSTLMNALIAHKIAGVSDKPQTTRNKILGIITEGDKQFLFLDSPGMHKDNKRRFNALMNKEARAAVKDADVVCYLVDIAAGWQDEDRLYLTQIAKATAAPVLILGSKADKKKMIIINQHAQIAQRELTAMREGGALGDHIAEDLRLISAKRPDDLTELKAVLGSYLPQGTFLFDEDDMTDRSEKFVCSEFIRETLFRLLGEELPYQVAVVVSAIKEQDDITVVNADIIVARASQKGIVIGKNGSKIKAIGQKARQTLESHFGKKVFLELEVVVSANWTESKELIAQFTELDPQ